MVIWMETQVGCFFSCMCLCMFTSGSFGSMFACESCIKTPKSAESGKFRDHPLSQCTSWSKRWWYLYIIHVLYDLNDVYMKLAWEQRHTKARARVYKEDTHTWGKCFISLNVKSLIAKPILVFISCVFHHPLKNYFDNCVWVDFWALCKISQPNLCYVVGFGAFIAVFLILLLLPYSYVSSREFFFFYFFRPFSFIEISFSSLTHLHHSDFSSLQSVYSLAHLFTIRWVYVVIYGFGCLLFAYYFLVPWHMTLLRVNFVNYSPNKLRLMHAN